MSHPIPRRFLEDTGKVSANKRLGRVDAEEEEEEREGESEVEEEDEEEEDSEGNGSMEGSIGI